MVALRGQAAVHGAGAHGDQDLAVGAELAQHVHVLGVADAALDDADVAGTAVLDVGERRAVELDAFEQRRTGARRCRAATCGSRSSRRATSVATFSLRRVTSFMALSLASRGAYSAPCADRRLVVAALADGHGEADALAQDHADRADLHRLVGGATSVSRSSPDSELTTRCLADAAPAEREDVLAVDFARGAHAQFAEDAAVEVEQDLGVRGVHRAVGEELVEARR